MRGYLTLKLLERLEERIPGWLDRVDLFAGTSTGSIVASALASGETIERCCAFYETSVPRVFGRPRSLMERAFRSKYSPGPLKEALQSVFGGKTFAALERKLLIPALRVDGAASAHVSPEVWAPSRSRAGGWRPAVMTNLPPVRGARPDIECTVVDAIMRSSAAPTIFPVYQGYADGGIWANNPATLAVAKAMLHERLGARDICVLSVGTGSWPRRVVEPGAPGDLGVAQWAPFLLEMLVDASSLTADMSAAHLLGDRYFRLSPFFEDEVPLDGASAMGKLADYANKSDVTAAAAFLGAVDDPDRARPRHDGPRALAYEELLGSSAGADLDSSAYNELVDLAWLDVARSAQSPGEADPPPSPS